MVDFSTTEQQNELSRLFLGTITPERDGGQLDPEAIHEQIIELARTVFLINPNAIFYLAALVRNSLRSVLLQEVDIVEDMLIAVDDVVRTKSTKLTEAGTADLRNAITTVSALEFASRLQNRPELDRFSRQVDRFTSLLRPAIVDDVPSFRLQSGEARSALRTNFQLLQETHGRLLLLIVNLFSLIENYEALDIPSRVSQNSLVRIRQQLTSLVEQIENNDTTTNDQNSRLYFLRTVASKVVVDLLANFRTPDLQTPALTSQASGFASKGIVGSTNSDLGSGPPFKLRPTGEASPALIVSEPGPWLLDTLSQSTLSVSVDGGTPQVVDLSSIEGPGLHGTIEGPWPDSIIHPVWPGPGAPTDPPPPPKEDYLPQNELHLVLDSNTYEFTSERWGYIQNDGDSIMEGEDTSAGVAPAPRGTSVPANIPDTPPDNNGNLVSDYWTTVRMQPPVKLGFKHLGCGLFFEFPKVPEDYSTTPSDAVPGAGFASWSVKGSDQLDNPDPWGDQRGTRWPYLLRPRVITELKLLKDVAITVSGDVITGPASSFEDSYIGYYIRTGTAPNFERYEIIEYISDTQVRIDFRGDVVPDQTVGLFGQQGDYTEVSFGPDLLVHTKDVADSDNLGPHNVRDTTSVIITPSIKTASIPSGLSGGGTISEIITALENPANGSQGLNKYAHASYHAIFKEQPGFTNKLTVQGRSRLLPEEFGISLQFFQYQPTLTTLSNTALKSGSSASIDSFSSNEQFLSGLTGVNEEDIGRTVSISGAATTDNNGFYEIIGIQKAVPTDPNIAPESGDPIDGAPIIFNPNGAGTDANNGSITWEILRTEEVFSEPQPQVIIENSAAEALGFGATQRANTEQDIYLTLEELEAVVSDGLSGADVEIVETDILESTATAQANSTIITDPDTDFSEIGVSLGYQVEILNGPLSGTYLVSSGSGSDLTLIFPADKNSRGFPSNSSEFEYRLFTRRLQIKSQSTERGSSVEVTSAPTQFGFPTGIQYGVIPSLEAVNKDGEQLDLSNLRVGDRINNNLVVTSVSDDGSTIEVDGGISTQDISFTFQVKSASNSALDDMISGLNTLFISPTLLGKYGFNSNLDRIDAALSPVLSPGSALQPNVNTLASLLAHLHSVLTSTVRTVDQFSTPIPTASSNVEDLITSYSAARVQALDSLFDSLEDQGYDRALALLLAGDLIGFFGSTYESASYAGSLLMSARNALEDLPAQSQLSSRVDETFSSSDETIQITDPDEDFSDTEGERELDLI